MVTDNSSSGAELTVADKGTQEEQNAREEELVKRFHLAVEKGDLTELKLILGGEGGSCVATSNAVKSRGSFLLESTPSRPGVYSLTDRTAMHRAVEHGHVVVVEFLLSQGAKVQSDLLHSAATFNSLDIAKLLVRAGADVNALDLIKYTPLCHARGQSGEMAQFLIDSGANVNGTAGCQTSPLSSLVSSLAACKILLAHGANVNQVRDGTRGWTPIVSAIFGGHTEVLKLLLDHNASNGITKLPAESFEDDLETLLHVSANRGDPDTVKLLLERGAEVHARDKEGRTPLHIQWGWDPAVVKQLLEAGADPRAKDNKGWTPLFHFASHEQCGSRTHLESWREEERVSIAEQVVKLLVDAGAELNAEDPKGNTPASLAIETSQLKPHSLNKLLDPDAKVLRKYGAKLRLHEAALIGDTDALESILSQRGASEFDINATRRGTTAMHCAIMTKRVDVVQSLLVKGADIECHDDKMQSPLSLATTLGHVEIVKVLLENGALVNTQDAEGMTPLHRSANAGSNEDNSIELCKLLLDHGAHPHTLNKEGCPPLVSMARRARVEGTKLLLSRPEVDVNCGFPLHAAAQYWSKTDRGSVMCEWDDEDPLRAAFRVPSIRVVKLLLDAGADVKALNKEGKDALACIEDEGLQPTVHRMLSEAAAACKEKEK